MTTEERRAELLAIVERDGRMLLQKAHEDRRTLLALVRGMRAKLKEYEFADDDVGGKSYCMDCNSAAGEHESDCTYSALLAATEGV